ncbi:DUF3099 domain-containing protein [Micromonospora sp. NPDC000207]|uniref:DUF3099 domain-containing protein n=1 Tax=Micromonospora sp. NPDC000207 TaxID=3154246 RepID=UPI00332CFDA0
MVKRQAYEPILITDAPRSQDDQLTSRQKQYLVMMLFRVACVVIGAVLVMVGVPLLWLWLSLCAVGMVLLPWLAVLIANDRPPKEEHRLVNRFRARQREETPQPVITAAEHPHKIIDAED